MADKSDDAAPPTPQAPATPVEVAHAPQSNEAPSHIEDPPADAPAQDVLDFSNTPDEVPTQTTRPPSISEEGRTVTPLPPPNAPFMENRQSMASNMDSTPGHSMANSILESQSSRNPLDPFKAEPDTLDKSEDQQDGFVEKPAKRNVRLLLGLGGLVSLAAIVAIVVGVYFGTRHHKSNNASANAGAGSSAPSSTSSSTPNAKSNVVYGGDGTVVTAEDGSQFTYNNSFGGYFVTDTSNPYTYAARAQSYTPPLNQTWQWGKDKIMGVNLGGWLVLEPFITPALYQKYTNAIDEWTLSTAMAADTGSGGLSQIEEHYKTFVTEEDFAQIAGAGLNWIRLPIAFWAIETWPGEPFLAKTSWKYALKAFDWARKYGLRIMLDLHAAPGSQNGYNHSGQFGKVNVLNGVMGIANAQRLLNYIRIITEFISQPEYKDLVLMFGIVNEPTAPIDAVAHFYIEAHRMIRNITGVGAGNGPFISIQGGNPNLPTFTGSDRIALEQHPYFAFNGDGSTNISPYIDQPCSQWEDMMNQKNFGVTTAGEFSLGFNDCGLFLHTTADEHVTQGCPEWDQWENYTPTQKQNLMSFAMSNMDALQHWFFWTWKIGPSAVDNSPRAPLWSYKLGLDNGWIPKDPRTAYGHCASLGAPAPPSFDGNYQPYQTGGGSGVINAADMSAYGQWPPASIGLEDNASLLPTYTATGPVPTLPTQTYPTPTPAVATTSGGDGWFNTADTAQGIITVAGCSYPNAWDATAAAVPPVCTGAGRKRGLVYEPVVTQAR